MASKKNSKNYAFRYSFIFGLIIFGVLFTLSGAILYHVFARAQKTEFVKTLNESQTDGQEQHEDSIELEHDEPRIRVDTVYLTKYVTEECKKKHCESTESPVAPTKDTTSQ